MAGTKLFYKMQQNIHDCYVYCTQKSVYLPFIKIHGPAHEVNRLNGLYNAQTKEAVNILMGETEE